MCRLLGIKANRPVDLTFSLLEAPDSLEDQSRWNRDGWGLCAWNGERWRLEKHPLQASRDLAFRAAALSAEGSAAIAHVRFSSVGGRSVENTHPFQHGTWAFAHNGTLGRSERLLTAIAPDLRAALRGSTDSERFFHVALTRIAKCAGGLGRGLPPEVVLPALREAVAIARARCDLAGLNFLLSDGDQLYAHRLGRELCWLDRRHPERPRMGWSSPETRALLESKALAGERALLVASEPLTGREEPWEDVTDGSFVVFTADLQVLRV